MGTSSDRARRDPFQQPGCRTALAHARDVAIAARRAKRAFLANPTHDLRTLMNGVLGMINLAKRRMTNPKGLHDTLLVWIANRHDGWAA